MSNISKLRIGFWWVTARQKSSGKGWHWDRFFSSPHDPAEARDWGGPDWIRSPISFKNIRQMRKGDIVIAYQSGSGILGLVRLRSDGYQHEGSPHCDTFDLDSKRCIRLKNPVPLSVLQVLPSAKDTFQFIKVGRGTVFAVERLGFEQLLWLMIAFNMEMEQQLLSYFSAAAASCLQ